MLRFYAQTLRRNAALLCTPPWLLRQIYGFYQLLLLGVLEGQRIPDHWLVLDQVVRFLGPLIHRCPARERVHVSNHLVQCYALLAIESESLLLRLSTLKEPSPLLCAQLA